MGEGEGAKWPTPGRRRARRWQWAVVMAGAATETAQADQVEVGTAKEVKVEMNAQTAKLEAQMTRIEELLRKVTSLAPKVASEQEITFRGTVGDKPPWGLAAPELTKWLDDHWVDSDALPDEQEQRRALVQQLSDTDGFELLTACTAETSTVPFVRISHTKNGKVIKDTVQA